MNDLMTKSFLSYVELKKQAQKGLEANNLEMDTIQLNSTEEQHKLSQFFQEVSAIQSKMNEIANLLHDLQNLNEEAKSTHSSKILRGLRDRMNSDMVSILRQARIVRKNLELLDRSNFPDRTVSKPSPIDRTRRSVTSGLKVKLRDMMTNFQSLRERIVSDHIDDSRRRYYSAKGEEPSEEVIERMISGGEKVELFEGKTDSDLGNKVRYETVIDIQRSLNKLHQVFLDMAILVETQGEKMDDIEDNMVTAGNLIGGGTNSLYYANQMKKNKKWVYWVWGVVIIIFILLVCLIAVLAS